MVRNIIEQNWVSRLLVLSLFTLYFGNLYCQEDSLTKHYRGDNIIPQSPTVANFSRYGDYPVDLCNGLVDISVPIYTINTGKLTLPISLSYHASGIKVNEIAGNIGLGWTLNAGGAVSINVKGVDDSVNTFYTDSEIDSLLLDRDNCPSILAHMNAWAYNTDSQADMYSYSAGALHGSFTYNANGELFQVPLSANRIEERNGFIITADDGTIYEFGKQNVSKTLSSNKTIVTAYHLSKIISADRTDSIVFKYRQVEPYYIYSPYFEAKKETDRSYVTGGSVYSNIHRYNITGFIDCQIDSIIFLNGKVAFTSIDTPDDLYPTSIVGVSVKNNRKELLKCSFVKDHFVSSVSSTSCPVKYTNRLRLNELALKYSDADTIKYKFEYDNQSLPCYDYLGELITSAQIGRYYNENYAQDYWGYYNGSTGNKHLIPKSNSISNDEYFHLTNNNTVPNFEPDFDYAKACILNKVVYPSGGFTRLVYELNAPNGGLRIHEINSYDRDNSLLESKEYLYGEGKDVSVRDYTAEGCYHNQSEYFTYYYPYHGTAENKEYLICTSSPNIQQPQYSSPTYYPNVTEIVKGTNGIEFFKTYRYNYVANEIRPNMQHSQTLSRYKYLVKDNFWRRGDLQEECYYDSDSTLLQKINYEYSNFNERQECTGLVVTNDVTDIMYGGMGTLIDIQYIKDRYDWFETNMNTAYKKMTRKTISDYSNTNTPFVTEEKYDFACISDTDGHSQITAKHIISGTDTLTTRYIYPQDIVIGSSTSTIGRMLDSFTSNNVVSLPFEYLDFIKHGSEKTLCAGTFVEYSGIGRPSKIYKLNPSSNLIYNGTTVAYTTFNKSNQYELVLTNTFDDNNRISQQLGKDGIYTSYLWSYKGQYPVAKITNATNNSVNSVLSGFSTGYLRISSGNGLPSNLRDGGLHGAFPNSVVNVYDYVPHIGMIYHALPNNGKFNYIYDGASRLLGIIRDFKPQQFFSYHLQPTDSYISTSTFISNDSSYRSMTYFDGLCRPTNVLSPQASGRYSLNLTDYDGAGRVSREWIPVAQNGVEKPDKNTFRNLAEGQYSNTNVFTEIEYDALGRKTRIHAPGDDWLSHPKTIEYAESAHDYPIINFRANLNNTDIDSLGTLNFSKLRVEVTKDEDNHILKTYADFLGRKILERNYNSDGENLDTYYVYNDLNQLRFVLTPSYSDENDIEKYAYEYRYDEKGNCIYKHLPGCSYTDFVYDDKDRIVITQDPLLREKDLYRFMLYDNLGRLAIQGTTSSYDTTQINNSIATKATGGTGHNYTGYYFCQPLLPVGFDIELVNYYDDYSFLEHSMFSGSQNSTELRRNDYVSGNNSNAVFSRGSMTGQMIATSDSTMLYNVFYYDQKGRVIDERHSTLDGDVYQITTAYSYTDKPTQTTKTLHYGQPDSYAIETSYQYNRYNDQLEQVTVSQGDRNEVVSRITYNDLGQIATESRANNADGVNYTYDLHGWTKTIVSPFFEEELFYADAINGAVPRYNGDISALSWKTDGKKHGYGFTYDNRDMLTNAIYAEETDAGGISISQKYNESATYNDNGGITMLTRKGKTNSGLYDAIDMLNYEYDGNKVINIADRIRNHLSYKDAFEYNDRHRGTAGEPDFEYNSAGMLVKDLDKGISQIIYNNIGLVDSIRFSNGNKIRYVYAMTGEKLRVTHYTATPTIFPGRFDDEITDPITDRPSNGGNRVAATTDTSSNGIVPGGSRGENEEVQELVMPLVKSSEILYIGDDLQLNTLTDRYTYLFGGGYCEFKPCAAYADSIKYYYYTKDHLGNVRNVISKNDNGQMEELQQTHYYPFGGIIADLSSGRDVQNHLYNGKELDTSNNLWWLDYGARQYDPTRGQFTNYDQHCESYYNTNPLTYCHNRPNMLIDPNGMDDFYDTQGNYLYTNRAKTDNIKIVDNCIFFTSKDGTTLAKITNPRSISEATEISADALSNIFTNILKRAGYDTSKLHNEKVSVIKYIAGSSGLKDEVANDPVMNVNSNTWARTTHDGNREFKITMVYDNPDAREMLSTYSNIINCLGSHEFSWHGRGIGLDGKKVAFSGDCSTLYENLMKTKSWYKTTLAYKNHVKDMIKYYKNLEK